MGPLPGAGRSRVTGVTAPGDTGEENPDEAYDRPGRPARDDLGCAGRAEISLLATQFAPQWTQVGVGDGVVWTNSELTNYPVLIGNHNIVPDNVTAAVVPGGKPFPASSPLLNPGASWACGAGESGLLCTGIEGTPVTVPPGRYTYMCGIHPNQMRGILDVS